MRRWAWKRRSEQAIARRVEQTTKVWGSGFRFRVRGIGGSRTLRCSLQLQAMLAEAPGCNFK